MEEDKIFCGRTFCILMIISVGWLDYLLISKFSLVRRDIHSIDEKGCSSTSCFLLVKQINKI